MRNLHIEEGIITGKMSVEIMKCMKSLELTLGGDRKEKRIIVLVTRRVRIVFLLDLIFEIVGTEIGVSPKK